MENRKIVIGKVCELNSTAIGLSNSPQIIHYLDISNITKNKIDTIQLLDSSVSLFPSRAKRKVKNGTIVYSTVRPNLEHFGYLENPEENLIVSTGFLTIDVVDNEIDSKFLYYSLTRKHITDYLHTIAVNNVSSYPSINPDDLGNLELEIPKNKFVQQQIATVLSSLDSKIELNNCINAELEAMAKCLYDYWFVQFDFPNAEGKPYKSSGCKMIWSEQLKRVLPDGWNVKNIGEVATVKAGGDKPGSFSIEKTKINKIPIYSNGISNDGLYGYTNKSIINKQSVTISARGTIGFCVLRNKPFVPIIRLISLTPNFTGGAKYFYEALKHFIFENSGSVQQQLTVPQVQNIKILYPNEDVLKKFDNITSPMIDRIENIKEENQQLSSLRDWLLPMLMNGQLTVGYMDEISGLMAAEMREEV